MRLFFLLLLIACGQASAQQFTQTVGLNPGWNAVYLLVEPEPSSIDLVFADVDVEEIREQLPDVSLPEFALSPETRTGQVRSLFWNRAEHEAALSVTPLDADGGQLFALRGNAAYLVKMPEAAKPIKLTLTGRPVAASPTWRADGPSLVGFDVDPENPPTFEEFFSASPELRSALSVKRLRPDGQEPSWEEVRDLEAARVEPGVAYMIEGSGINDYAGPVTVALEQGRGIDFGRVLQETSVRIINHSSNARTLTVDEIPSAASNSEGATLPDEPVPLFHREVDPDAGEASWRRLEPGLQLDLAPNSETVLRLGIRRRGMVASARATSKVPQFASLLELRDGQGTRLIVPVSATGTTLAERYRGLWVGTVAIDRVSAPHKAPAEAVASRPRATQWMGTAAMRERETARAAIARDGAGEAANLADAEPPDLMPTASPFQFRIIVHVDEAGEARLLREVIQLWREGTYKPDPQDPTKQIVDEPGSYALFADAEAAMAAMDDGFTGSALRDGVPVGRRISSAVFSFREPPVMEGAFAQSLSVQLEIPYDDPVNPFKHRYHPDHDNRDALGASVPDGREVFTVTRNITLRFEEPIPGDGSAAPLDAGDGSVSGTYIETLRGLHRKAISTAGRFSLRRIVRGDQAELTEEFGER